MQNKPMRIFEGSAQPFEPFWRVRNANESESGDPELEFYGYISEYSWWEDDITPKKFKDDLYKLGAGGPITIRMNSGGGDVIAASVIRSTLVEYPGTVTVRIDGLAASAATIVAMAGDKVRMQDSAFFMIHDPSVLAFGNLEELKRAIDLLKTVKDGIMDTYESRTQLGREKLSKMMTDETWMTAKEAAQYGFVDEVIGDAKQSASPLQNVAVVNALRDYRNLPEALQVMLQSAPVIQPQAAAEPPEVARLRAEAKFLLSKTLSPNKGETR